MVPPDTSSWRRLPYCVLPTLCVALSVSETLNAAVPVVGAGMPSGMPHVQEGSGTIVAPLGALPPAALPPVALPPMLVVPPTLGEPPEVAFPPAPLAPPAAKLPPALLLPAVAGEAVPALPGAPPEFVPPVAGSPGAPPWARAPACAVAPPVLLAPVSDAPHPTSPPKPQMQEHSKRLNVGTAEVHAPLRS